MKENQVSFTAMMVAYMRAYHAMNNTYKIFDDFLAYHLIPEEKRTLIEQHFEQYFTGYTQVNGSEYAASYPDQTAISSYLMQATNVISRAQYAEDALEKAVKQGVTQYVILGAGMDTFAFRKPEMMKHLEVFEVDHPATQEFKLHRLAELEWEHSAKLHFIPIDFTKESLVTALTNSSSYDSNVKSFFSWLGVILYLTNDEVFTTLRSITEIAPMDSKIVFDYFDTDVFIPEKSSPQMQKLLEYLRKIGEPMITGFDPSNLAEELASLGFSLQENLSPTDIEEYYFKGRTDGYHAREHVHFACAVIK
jgi:methyltransferase (TIGR00027 family)